MKTQNVSLLVALWKSSEYLATCTTALHHHVLVLLVHHIIGRVNVQNTDGAESGRDAAGRWRGSGIHGVHESLDDGVIGRLQMRADGKVADAVAVEGLVLQRRDDPVVPSPFPWSWRATACGCTSVWGSWLFFSHVATVPDASAAGWRRVLVDGLVVVTRTGFDLVVKEPSLFFVRPKHNKERLFPYFALPARPRPSDRKSLRSALIGRVQLKAKQRSVSEVLEQFPDVKHFPVRGAYEGRYVESAAGRVCAYLRHRCTVSELSCESPCASLGGCAALRPTDPPSPLSWCWRGYRWGLVRGPRSSAKIKVKGQ